MNYNRMKRNDDSFNSNNRLINKLSSIDINKKFHNFFFFFLNLDVPRSNAERARTPVPMSRSNFIVNQSQQINRQFSPMRSVNLSMSNPIGGVFAPPPMVTNTFSIDQNLLISSPIHHVKVSREYSPMAYRINSGLQAPTIGKK